MSAPAGTARRRVRVRVRGTVQGVGFRPFIYRLANTCELDGFVRNDSAGVLIEAQGEGPAVDDFLSRLRSDAPPLARIEDVHSDDVDLTATAGFTIDDSPRDGTVEAPVTPDSATCADCLAEVLDPADRRYRYAFTNCTNCGPRFTIVRGIPYDRPYTTMASFRMCERCLKEYEDPADRRFHAQPNACPDCGPSLALFALTRREPPRPIAGDPIRGAACALAAGLIVAVKGIGGVHLACDAASDAAVATLRMRKHREDRPFALMVSGLEAAERLAEIDASERALLESPERPIVLARRRRGTDVAAPVAPRALELGLMLPYSPLHHLLLSDFGEAGGGEALVMTSGNLSDEPIAYRDEDARERMAGLADLLLTHDREIATRTDDSVVRVAATRHGPARPVFVRRSRGYVPAALPLPGAGTGAGAILACGAEQKSTFCLARRGRAIVSHHIGDLENFETLSSFAAGIEHFKRLFELDPAVVAHDLHPEYLSTKYAQDLDGVRLVGVQHHHAHLAACLAEHGEEGPAIGAIFDGTGYGTEGSVWGGELLSGGAKSAERVGMLRQVRLPGGAAAIREPWRMACAWLAETAPEPAIPRSLQDDVEEERWRQVLALVRGGNSAPLTSSMGRLLDAVAALCGVRARVNYEGQAAIELEALCDPHERGSYPIDLAVECGTTVLDPREAVARVARDAEAGVPVGRIAARFHAGVAAATVRACVLCAEREHTELAVLSGGVFLNRRLLEATADGLSRAGLRVLVPERLPVGDGGISYGQAAVAARRLLDGGGAV